MTHWATDAIFYHIYPLGLCGAPKHNDFHSPVEPRLAQLYGWIDHLRYLGVNAVYLGPLFESSAHGYDTADYYRVDRRLGDNTLLADLAATLHREGIRVILDGVFNHVGRDFWAFRHVLEHGQGSPYCAWFQGLSFEGRSPYQDPFTYQGWNGHYDLVKLNLQVPEVRQHLFQAVEMWIRDFDIDGLRLDAADCIEMGFLQELAGFCRRLRPDFWLVGEIVHGDYRTWANPQTLDSVTNYECYKGLYSSHVDKNYFEIAYALNRQFGEQGLYRGLPLYNFADNHDVNRVASNLKKAAHLYPLYCLLFTMPGVPSIYYGSEWGLEGKKKPWSDRRLRPPIELSSAAQSSPHPDLAKAIARLSQVRRNSPALRHGDYRQLFVGSQQLAFARQSPEQSVVVVLNADGEPAKMEVSLPFDHGRQLIDLLNPTDAFPIRAGKARIDPIYAHWARILEVK